MHLSSAGLFVLRVQLMPPTKENCSDPSGCGDGVNRELPGFFQRQVFPKTIDDIRQRDRKSCNASFEAIVYSENTGMPVTQCTVVAKNISPSGMQLNTRSACAAGNCSTLPVIRQSAD
jgi:hypothetical protein